MNDAYQTAVFTHHAQDWYRIPSIAVTPRGTVLAFASRRKGDGDDFGHETDVVLRRSTDGGRTFAPMATLASAADTDIHHGPVVVDQATGAICKFCRYWPASGNPQRFVSETLWPRMIELGYTDHLLVSTDDGVTWSAPRPLALDYPEEATSCGTGNGNHGIHLANGRLLVQGGYVLNGQRHHCLFASDDGGASWHRTASGPHSTLREFTLAQLADGSLYYNFRVGTPGVATREISRDRSPGEAFGEVVADPTLPEPQCHAGLVHLGDNRLVFTNPDHANRDGSWQPGLRRDLTARLSLDGGRTWPIARQLNQRRAGYSDLAVAPDGTIHCLYEDGEDTSYDQLTLASFSLDWLTDGD